MAMYRECPLCGANLDPGERCDCEELRLLERERKSKMRKHKAEMLRLSDTDKGWKQQEFAF